MADLHGLFSSDRDDWETPQALFDELDAKYHFTLDAASSDANAKCERHYTAKDSGLDKSWGGGACILQSAIRTRDSEVGQEMRGRDGRLHMPSDTSANGHVILS